ncbi:TIGR02677 family protein [Actinopolyspora lacussalsi subsp. righensis]|uniref:TIGR02677 family protein n=1 Tax=Actinopolyspora righensis TaxID=995060 RepID=A0A1I6YPI7_9ACTN|nr:DUF2397 domain-containing protein [Actinopolyspora righensis]SFT52121.1 TIGR02677 family protein [Actinopolyspora righensis]
MTADHEAVEPRSGAIPNAVPPRGAPVARPPGPERITGTGADGADLARTASPNSGTAAAGDEVSDSPTAERDLPAGAEVESGERRLLLYRHLQVSGHRTYLTIMRLFTSTLLADLSAAEVAGTLAVAEREGRIAEGESELSTVVERLRKLREWGNLTHGRRETTASSIAEFQHGSVRFQVSKLGVRVQRDVDALLRVPEGAREVSRELLPAIERGLSGIVELLPEETSAAALSEQTRERISEQVTTVFLQHSELADTVRDFYAYLGQVVTRHHLNAGEISGFRNLLVEYIQSVVEDVIRHTEPIAASLSVLARRRDQLLAALGPVEDLGDEVERARGRTGADWQELTDWFLDSPGRPSQVSALREATARAIGSLLASVKHATSGGGPVPGRRSDLLHLARWFDDSDQAGAHRLYAAAFGLYSSRCFQPAPPHDGDEHATSWLAGNRVEIPVNVRNRADRSGSGGTSRVLHDPMTERQLLDERRAEQQRRAAAVAELAAASENPAGSRFSADALEVLCELLTLAMADREDPAETRTALEPVHRLRLRIRHSPEGPTTISSVRGELTLRDTAVELDVSEMSGRFTTTGAANHENVTDGAIR